MARAEAKNREKSEGARESADANAKRDAEAAERVRAWAEAEVKEKDNITRISDEAGGEVQYRCCREVEGVGQGGGEGKGRDRQGRCSG